MASVKVKCPKCHKVAGISAKLIPEGGASARCPNCGEKIRINKPANGQKPDQKPAANKRKTIQASPKTGSQSKPAAPRPSSVRPSQRPKDLETMVNPPPPKHDDDDIEFERDLALVTVETDIGHGYEWRIVSFIFVLLAALVLVITVSNIAAPPEEAPAVNQYDRGIGDLYRGPEIQKVVGRMRNKIRRKSFREYEEKPASAEGRLTSRILKNCNLKCSTLKKVSLAPITSGDGFTATAFCTGEKEYKIIYHWTNNNSMVDGKECP